MHRRLLWFSVPAQALQVLPLFALAHAVELVLRMAGWRHLSGVLGAAGRAAAGDCPVAAGQLGSAGATAPPA